MSYEMKHLSPQKTLIHLSFSSKLHSITNEREIISLSVRLSYRVYSKIYKEMKKEYKILNYRKLSQVTIKRLTSTVSR